MTKVALTAALLSLLSAASVQAATHYSGVAVFGDSLSDNGNFFALSSAVGPGQPPSPYFEGRFSNGPVWADHIAADFAAKGLHAENYAYGFGQAVTNVDTQFQGLQAPDLAAQIDEFKASGSGSLLGDRPVATVWAGSNDLLNTLGSADPTGVPAAMVAAAGAIAGGIESLAETGIKDFVVFNMVPVEKTPRLMAPGTPIEAQLLATLGVATFNATLDGLLAGFGGDTRITKVDIHAAMNDVIANPGDYGVSDVSTPCFVPGAGLPPCTAEQAGERMFWDLVHPTTEIHAAIADLVRTEVAPVPLPAPLLLILAGMAGLAAAGARRRKR